MALVLLTVAGTACMACARPGRTERLLLLRAALQWTVTSPHPNRQQQRGSEQTADSPPAAHVAEVQALYLPAISCSGSGISTECQSITGLLGSEHLHT